MNLTLLNPWWEDENAIELDKHLRELKKFRYIHVPSLLSEKFQQGNLYVIRGPRQVGKTTFLKMFIRERLKDTPKESIFYWSCDNLTIKEDLIDLIGEYVEFCRVKRSDPQYIVLDEITGIIDWQKAMKFIIDSDMATNACFILTGSSALDLKKGSERLPGRRGQHGKDLYLLPLTFREYVRLTDPEWFGKHGEEHSEELKFQNGTLKVLFERYLATGGIPLVINEFQTYGEVPTYIYDLYYSWIVGDMLKEGKNEQNMKEIMKGLLSTYTTTISWDSIAKRSSIRSHVTVGSYLEILSNMFVIASCYFYHINEGSVNYSKNKKFYFIDPFILRIFEDRLNIRLDKDKVVEGIVAYHLKNLDMTQDIFYTRFKKETDFIHDGQGIEVKYQNRITDDDFQNRRFFRDFLILSKDSFADEVVPVHIFLFGLRTPKPA